jgi:hypothetical protein
MKMCVDCGDEKDENDFYSYELTKNRGRCKECLRKRSKTYNAANKDKKRMVDKQYQEKNKDQIKITKNKYVENNRLAIKQQKSNWYNCNRGRILKEREEYRSTHKDARNVQDRNRRATDPVYRIRTNMSKLINQRLRKMGSSKNDSITKYLPYIMSELKEHLEKQFESWMTWDNYGRYNAKTWDDTNPLTWTWNIDHIIPQANLPYTTMEDENFKKCWALSNLRPLSAKTNVINGTSLGKQRKKRQNEN